jgi:hypothetical protein
MARTWSYAPPRRVVQQGLGQPLLLVGLLSRGLGQPLRITGFLDKGLVRKWARRKL